jgi:hypothetical protein
MTDAERGEAPGGAQGTALAAAIEAARVAIRMHWQEAGGWSGRVTYDSLADTAVRAAEPILRQAAVAENDRTWCDIMATVTDRDKEQSFNAAVFDALKAERDGLRGKVEAVRALCYLDGLRLNDTVGAYAIDLALEIRRLLDGEA